MDYEVVFNSRAVLLIILLYLFVAASKNFRLSEFMELH